MYYNICVYLRICVQELILLDGKILLGPLPNGESLRRDLLQTGETFQDWAGLDKSLIRFLKTPSYIEQKLRTYGKNVFIPTFFMSTFLARDSSNFMELRSFFSLSEKRLSWSAEVP